MSYHRLKDFGAPPPSPDRATVLAHAAAYETMLRFDEMERDNGPVPDGEPQFVWLPVSLSRLWLIGGASVDAVLGAQGIGGCIAEAATRKASLTPTTYHSEHEPTGFLR